MEKELEKKKPGRDVFLSRMLCSSLGAVACILVELYLMICMPAFLPGIAVAGLACLFCCYMALSSWTKRVLAREAQQEEQTANILKSEKATYLLTRKYCDELGSQLTLLEDKLTEPLQDVISAQKATAKVTISRNKENTDALMNSNDKLLDLVFQMDERITAINRAVAEDVVSEDMREQEQQLSQQLELTKQLAGQLREMELGLKNEILQAANQIMAAAPQVVMAQQAPQPMPVIEHLMEEEPELEPMMEEEPELEPIVEEEIAEPEIEPEPIIEEEIEEPELEPEPIVEEEIAEPEIEPEPIIEEEIAEPEIEPEPEEELPPMPDLSDPNKVMSPDEIAALFANLG